MRLLMTHSGPCLACGRCGVNLLQGLSGLVLVVPHCRALYSVSFNCLICKVTAPTFVGQVGGEMTGAEPLHRVGA